MLQLAELLPNPNEPSRLNLTKEGLAIRRAQRYDLLGAMVAEHVPQIRSLDDYKILLEYMQPTYPDKYNLGLTTDNPDPSELAARVKQYIDDTDLDGIYLDTPFENVPMPIISYSIIKKMVQASPSIIMPNFGDGLTYMGHNKLLAQTVESIKECTSWHLIEVAVSLSQGFRSDMWYKLLDEVELQLSRGKHLVLGIYDPTGARALTAYSLVATLQDPNIYWLYKAHLTANFDQLWNPYYQMIGGRTP